MHLTSSVVLAVSAILGSFDSHPVVVQPFAPAQTVEEYVRDYFADVPVMAAIAKCESHFTHVKDGKILKNSTSSAVGVFQIMSSIHAANAEKNLGIDITSIEGNVAYARYLYEKEGTKPWNASKACWGKSEEAKNHVASAN